MPSKFQEIHIREIQFREIFSLDSALLSANAQSIAADAFPTMCTVPRTHYLRIHYRRIIGAQTPLQI